MDTSLVLDKSNKDWMAAMTATGVRHYIYPVHLSQVRGRGGGSVIATGPGHAEGRREWRHWRLEGRRSRWLTLVCPWLVHVSVCLLGLRVHAVAVGRALHPALQVHRTPGTDRPPPPGAGVWAVVAEQGFAAVYVWYLCALCVLLQYDYAFRFVSSCVSDTDLTPEEGQVHTDTPHHQ